MTTDWKNRTAVITGGGSGIGRETALKLAQNGMNIILLGGKRAEKLQETALLAETFGVKTAVIPGDLTNFAWLKETVAQITQALDVDVLINNAGMVINCGYADVTEDQFDSIMNLNVKVPFFLTQHLLPTLKKSSHATIVNLCSVVAHAGYPNQSAYTASKHALLGLTKSLAAEVYQDGVRVHAICPGGVYTDMVKIARPDLTPDGMIQPQEIAEIVWFFLQNRGNAVVDEIQVHRVNKQPFLT